MSQPNNSLFYKDVDKRNKEEMRSFLTDHFTYNTMNSWNHCVSFANKIKLHSIRMPKELLDKAYDIIYLKHSDWQYEFMDILHDFEDDQDGKYTVGTNGRSGGYLVLYKTDGNGGTYIGQSVIPDIDELDIDGLRYYTELVQAFDKTCDDIVSNFKWFCANYDVVEETIFVPTQVKILKYTGE